jgi:hypothetical protein
MKLMHTLALAPLVVCTSCGDVLTDAATRLGRDLSREAAALRASSETTRTFEHHPSASPEGVTGDYCIELVLSQPNVDGHSLILVGDEHDGPLRWSTTAHNRSVHTERDFRAPHPNGGPTLIMLEKRGSEIWVVDVR